MITILYHLLPNLPILDFVAQGAPLGRPKGGFTLFGIELEDRVEDGQVQGPYFDAGRPGSFRCRGWVEGAVGVIFGLGDGGDQRENGGEGFWQTTREEESRGLSVGLCDVRGGRGGPGGVHGRGKGGDA